MRLIILAIPALALAACATPSAQISTALQGYGLAPAQSICVGDTLQRNLSLGQLQELARLARVYRERNPSPNPLTAEDFVRVASQVRDPSVPLEVARAAASCNVLSAIKVN